MNLLPVVIIGAGPIGLAMAAKLAVRNIPFSLFEKGQTAGSSIKEWGHVNVFTPWEMNVDEDAKTLLLECGWTPPKNDEIACGKKIYENYLLPLSQVPAIKANLHTQAEIVQVVRHNLDKTSIELRKNTPFKVTFKDTQSDQNNTLLARAVIDASGVWNSPNPIGVDGFHVPGEQENASYISYGIPDISGKDKTKYVGKKVLVVGSGHSAMASLFALDNLHENDPSTEVIWAMRRGKILNNLSDKNTDAIKARGELNSALPNLISKEHISVLAPSRISAIKKVTNGLDVEINVNGETMNVNVDFIIVSTGFRPETGFISELQYQLDPVWEAPLYLVDLINPHLHSCGSVPNHGVKQLYHPEPDFFIVGHKSYGRAPTFLMKTGYEQLNSIANHIEKGEEIEPSIKTETRSCSI
ncbi:NAD(P)-binding domain-containing protein [Thalassotalea profundi]|uniref:Flavoprotein n=1 Tax=Thalassotalea profundi TaxID=2036687 RepID=A0ABQ3IMV5_9GAMM|nr:NAD(P)-binding domain-containing protein [Thalassotalea profundi]GHE88299.1 flavoprotein [Thalassotalea profundi]